MSINNILAEIDAEIVRLEKVRSLLAPTAGKTKKAGKKAVPVVKKKRFRMSSEGRAKIAAAQRKRWAEQRKNEKKKESAKNAVKEKAPF